MATFEAWKKKRTPLKTKLTRFKNSFAAYDKSLGIGTWPLQLEQIEPVFAIFDEVQTEIDMIFENDNEALQIQLEEREEFEHSYFEIVSQVREFIKGVRSGPVSESNSSSSQNSVSLNFANLLSMSSLAANLPILTIPKFDGSFKDWVKFRDSFKSMVHNRTELSNVQKFHHLNSSLTGDAARVIQSLGVSEANYDLAWRTLTDRYEDSRALVHYHIKALFDLPTLTKSSCLALRQLIDDTNNNLLALSALGEPTESWDTMTMHLLSTKLDFATKREWEKRLLSARDKPTFKFMIEFLENHCKYLQRISADKQDTLTNGIQNKKSNSKYNNGKPSVTSCATTQKKCLLCEDSHALVNCGKLRALPVDSRIGTVARLRVCFNCLKPGHRNKECTLGTCAKCPGKHNTILHIEKGESSKKESVPSNSIEPNEQSSKSFLVAHCTSEDKAHVLLGTAIVYVKDRHGNRHECRALLDSCSQVHLMTETFCKRLKVPVDKSQTVVSGVFKTSQEPQYRAQVMLESRCTGFSATVKCLIMPEITDEMPNVSLQRSEFNIPDGLTLADPDFENTRPIDLLIGGGLFWKLLCVGQIQLREDQPILQKTQLGWIVAGPMALPSSQKKYRVICNLITNQQLHQDMQRFWEIENHTIKERYPALDPRDVCEQHFLATTKRDCDGRFIVNIPFKDEVSDLGESLKMAHKRLLAMERKLGKDTELRDKYIDFLTDYEKQGHMTLIPEEEQHSVMPVFYLPHHAVMKEGSTTTKVRVVFDGSAKTSSGLSLNEVQRVGSTVQNDLFSITLRFRQYPIAFSADITKMYRQIKIDKDQQDLQRILWRTDSTKPIQHFRLTTVTYGTASAPFLATRALRQIGEENKEVYPATSDVIIRDFYVDDVLTGANTVEEARTLRSELIELLSKAGLELRKWASNNLQVFAKDNPLNAEKLIQSDKDPKTLGLSWDPGEDTLKYSVRESSSQKVTKRIILSKIAQIFDPLGLVGPAIIRAKIIMQELWKLQLGWDEALPQDLHTLWIDFHDQLQSLNKISVPRFACCSGFVKVQLHGFCDASEAAYGVCVYLRTLNKQGQCTIRLLCAKSRVAPLKNISLPRLELQAALLLAQLMETVTTSLSLTADDIYYWTDSTVTLCWIRSPSNRWKTFVANRTSEIQQLTNQNWNHVSTNENPADLISRGINPNDLMSSKLWWTGPDWLSKHQRDWPSQDNVISEPLEIVPEERKCERVVIVTNELDFSLLRRYSTLYKLIRVTAFCLRFIKNAKSKKIERTTGNFLKALDISNALTSILRLAQVKEFSSELKEIKESEQVSNKSKLCALKPFIDEKGILRVGGRLVNAPILFDQKHPIILAPRNPLTTLIIREEHERLMHAGCQAVVASLRSRYWPLNCKNAVKDVINKCVPCFKARPKNVEYVMGNLPSARVTQNRPFYVCGVDYAGPYQVIERSRSRLTSKAYICIFVCFVTKAVHIGLARDLSTEAFLNCLRRFISRRGKCQQIHSDNGTNFVGARRELNELHELLRNRKFQETVNDFLLRDQIQWHMIPPHAPNFGGLWEGAVKSAKKHLTKVIGETRLTFEELYTVLTQVESCLNSRPLSPLSSDPTDFNPLTPGHFLIGDSLSAIPQTDLRVVPQNRLSRYEHLQQMVQHFWDRWHSEYLSQLQQRQKWTRNHKSFLAPGVMVIIKEDNQPLMKWRLGRIVELHPGRDNITRVVSVRVSDSTLKRPVSKICILPIEQDLVEPPQ